MTKRKIARSKRTNKPSAENPIKRAARRAGIKPTDPSEALSPEDEAIIADLDALGLRSTNCRGLVARMRAEGHENDTVRRRLLHEGHVLRKVAERIKPEQPTRDAMLEDALEIVDLAESVFYVNGLSGGDHETILHEALSSLEQDLEGFGSRLESSSDVDIAWQELWRARDRAKLARHLAEFRRRHGDYKPTKKGDEHAAEGGAS